MKPVCTVAVEQPNVTIEKKGWNVQQYNHFHNIVVQMWVKLFSVLNLVHLTITYVQLYHIFVGIDITTIGFLISQWTVLGICVTTTVQHIGFGVLNFAFYTTVSCMFIYLCI